jgi:hypothetical protein
VIDLAEARLRNQRLAASPFTQPDDVVSWFGAVQAQEYGDAKWALALRLRRADGTAIERAMTEGKILRTHVMRPTWHFVTPADIRWLLALTGPSISRRMAPYNRRLEISADDFRRSERTIVRALSGGAQLTRQELKAALLRDGVKADGVKAEGVQRLAHLVMQAEIDGVICSGARRGAENTYALLDERVPAETSRTLTRDAALEELARRYFTSHGPAQLPDFAWWSGLSATDARAGLTMAAPHLGSDVVDGRTYWFPSSARRRTSRRDVFLLPLYDEYLIAYKDRRASLDMSAWTARIPYDPFSAAILVRGRVAGAWKKAPRGDTLAVTLTPFGRLSKRDAEAIEASAHAYAKFVGRRLMVSYASRATPSAPRERAPV